MESLLTFTTRYNVLVGIYLLASTVRSYFWTRAVLRKKSQRRHPFPGYISVVAIWLVAFSIVLISNPFYILYGAAKKLSSVKRLRRRTVYQDTDIESGPQIEDTVPGRWNGTDLTTLRKRFSIRDNTYALKSSLPTSPVTYNQVIEDTGSHGFHPRFSFSRKPRYTETSTLVCDRV
ncbi:hypothetical protein F4805DRAFT_453574 [Annulohypoxylon moriforme]|nr:hypothetical protein F4805DRAFT_453574 [Annulohypoxylon moriforme]